MRIFRWKRLTYFNMYGKTAGVIGTGKIGIATMRILKGFGMNLLAYDPFCNPEVEKLGGRYVDLDELYARSDIITLHCPSTPENHYMLNEAAFDKMKDGVMIINTSRGGLIDSSAAIEALKRRKIGALGMDVYENERELFFEDKSNDVITDDVFRRLSSCHNVLFTGHQAFLTEEALGNISEVTLSNIREVGQAKRLRQCGSCRRLTCFKSLKEMPSETGFRRHLCSGLRLISLPTWQHRPYTVAVRWGC